MKAGLVTVGETLSHARHNRGLSVDEVAADTRIRATLIRAIEADDFHLCGGAVYARGHIRSIARFVGVDPEPLISEFDAAHQVEQPIPVAAAPATDAVAVARSERRKPNWTAAIAIALVVICALALAPLVLHHSDGGTPNAASTPPVVHQSTQSSPQPSGSPPPSAVAQLPANRATMLVRATERTWLSITTKAGQKLFYGLLEPGQHKVFSNRHGLDYVIGNAPAVDLVVNGHDIGSPPSSGNVSRGSVAPGANTVQQA
jgi:cytoskeleton protein RodZ